MPNNALQPTCESFGRHTWSTHEEPCAQSAWEVQPTLQWLVPPVASGMQAMCGPTAVMAYNVSRILHRSSQSKWPAIIQAALVPLSIGLMTASALVLAQAADRTWLAVVLTGAAAILTLATRLNPLWLLLAGGCLGFAGVV